MTYTKGTLIGIAVLVFVLAMSVVGCGPSKADVAAKNLSTAAENFQVPRHIVGINGITDKYLFEIVGYCSVETAGSGLPGALAAVCRVNEGGKDKYKKTFLGLSDNVTFVVEQLEPVQVSEDHFRVIFRPQTLIPNFDNG